MDGILLVDKPQGMTSHDIVDFVRRTFGLKKVGHAGTLDPMATGLLVILVGACTKKSNSLSGDDKEYVASLVLGATTDTQDAEGKVSSRSGNINFTRDEIDASFRRFLGEIEQIPPMYSAIKFKGKKLYELARKGIAVERRPRRVVIKELEILKVDLPSIEFRVRCSKGTYIRQLCHDIGATLGCGAYLSRLRRTRSGNFRIDNALTIEKLENVGKADLARIMV